MISNDGNIYEVIFRFKTLPWCMARKLYGPGMGNMKILTEWSEFVID